MKIINLNESQFGRIFEGVTDGDFGKSSVPEYQDLSKVTNQSKIIDQDGDEIDSNPITTDKFASQQTPQQWGSVGGRKSSNTI
jgi:hypothetical protein